MFTDELLKWSKYGALLILEAAFLSLKYRMTRAIVALLSILNLI